MNKKTITNVGIILAAVAFGVFFKAGLSNYSHGAFYSELNTVAPGACQPAPLNEKAPGAKYVERVYACADGTAIVILK